MRCSVNKQSAQSQRGQMQGFPCRGLIGSVCQKEVHSPFLGGMSSVTTVNVSNTQFAFIMGALFVIYIKLIYIKCIICNAYW